MNFREKKFISDERQTYHLVISEYNPVENFVKIKHRKVDVGIRDCRVFRFAAHVMFIR